jgi:hypothetical protein
MKKNAHRESSAAAAQKISSRSYCGMYRDMTVAAENPIAAAASFRIVLPYPGSLGILSAATVFCGALLSRFAAGLLFPKITANRPGLQRRSHPQIRLKTGRITSIPGASLQEAEIGLEYEVDVFEYTGYVAAST